MATYNVPICNINDVREKLASIKKKCDKYGCEFSYSEGEPFVVEEQVAVSRYEYKKMQVRRIPVEVTGLAKVDGWEFLAVIEHHEKGNLIKTGNFDVEIPKQYETCGPWCDHCKRIRSRKDSYLVRNTVTGEIKQVGKACLKDFTNGLDAEHVARLATYFDEIENYFAEGSYGVRNNYLDIVQVLALASVVVSKYGYVKTKNEYDERNSDSTKDRVNELIGFRRNPSWYEEYLEDRVPELRELSNKAYEEELINKALEIKNYYMNLSEEEIEKSAYLRNLYVLLSDDEIDPKNLGLAVSAVAAYKKHLEGLEYKEQQEKKAAIEKIASNYVGEIGERITFNAIVNLVSSWDTMYGTTWLYKMKDESGNVLTCFATSPLTIEDESKTYTVAATVKKHEEYKGVKQTVVQRCKIK